MESEIILESEQRFWDELQQIVSTPCEYSEDLIDNVLRAYLSLTVQYKDEYLNSELDISRCSFKLFSSSLYAAHGDYVRRQLLYGLLQEDDPKTLHLISSFLLFDGRQNEATFHTMNDEGAFPRLLELLQRRKKDGRNDDEDDDGGAGLDRLLMDLLYEMSRVQRVKIGDLVLVDDDFVKGLFELIENLSDDVNDPYHYPVIRVLLVLNEQFMISAHDPIDERSGFLTNKIIKVLSMQGNYYKTFGENIILLINREAETSLQLLTLKLLYLLFTTPSTFEYFYTNDLRVLVDILIRNLLDLPEEASALRHTYLRVLYPLLAHTQLRYPPYYKRDELKRMLNILIRGQLAGQETDEDKIQHFEDVDETTKRLVMRCATVEWMRDVKPEPELEPQAASRTGSVSAETGEPLEASQTTSPSSSSDRDTASPTGQQQAPGSPDIRHHHRKLSAVKRLGMHLEPASSSSLSVREVASQHEKPGVITPSRTDLPRGTEFVQPGAKPKPKIKPEPPKARRWRGRRNEEDSENVDKIPEDAQVQSSPITRSVTPTPPPSVTQANRRRSTSTSSSLAPPIPAHSRRSASNPPPAVPPPRRSATHPAGQPQNINNHNYNYNAQQPGKYGQKPEPPKTRRWGRKQAQQSEQSGTEHTISVEEAVQNVSLE